MSKVTTVPKPRYQLYRDGLLTNRENLEFLCRLDKIDVYRDSTDKTLLFNFPRNLPTYLTDWGRLPYDKRWIFPNDFDWNVTTVLKAQDQVPYDLIAAFCMMHGIALREFE